MSRKVAIDGNSFVNVAAQRRVQQDFEDGEVFGRGRGGSGGSRMLGAVTQGRRAAGPAQLSRGLGGLVRQAAGNVARQTIGGALGGALARSLSPSSVRGQPRRISLDRPGRDRWSGDRWPGDRWSGDRWSGDRWSGGYGWYGGGYGCSYGGGCGYTPYPGYAVGPFAAGYWPLSWQPTWASPYFYGASPFVSYYDPALNYTIVDPLAASRFASPGAGAQLDADALVAAIQDVAREAFAAAQPAVPASRSVVVLNFSNVPVDAAVVTLATGETLQQRLDAGNGALVAPLVSNQPFTVAVRRAGTDAPFETIRPGSGQLLRRLNTATRDSVVEHVLPSQNAFRVVQIGDTVFQIEAK